MAAIRDLLQSALGCVRRTRSVARLDPVPATRRYARAIGIQLGLDRLARREVDAVACVALAPHLAARLGDLAEARYAAGHLTELWNGAGTPAGLTGAWTPLPARIVGVAQTWSALTARGTLELGHREALADLRSAAGLRLDPEVVAAAGAVIAQQRDSAAEPAPRPHWLGLPASRCAAHWPPAAAYQ